MTTMKKKTNMSGIRIDDPNVLRSPLLAARSKVPIAPHEDPPQQRVQHRAAGANATADAADPGTRGSTTYAFYQGQGAPHTAMPYQAQAPGQMPPMPQAQRARTKMPQMPPSKECRRSQLPQMPQPRYVGELNCHKCLSKECRSPNCHKMPQQGMSGPIAHKCPSKGMLGQLPQMPQQGMPGQLPPQMPQPGAPSQTPQYNPNPAQSNPYGRQCALIPDMVHNPSHRAPDMVRQLYQWNHRLACNSWANYLA